MTEFSEGAAMVFGGSGGIGRGVALELGHAGTAVAICYRLKADVASEIAAEVRALGVGASVHQVDVRDRAAIDTARNAAIAGQTISVSGGFGV